MSMLRHMLGALHETVGADFNRTLSDRSTVGRFLHSVIPVSESHLKVTGLGRFKPHRALPVAPCDEHRCTDMQRPPQPNVHSRIQIRRRTALFMLPQIGTVPLSCLNLHLLSGAPCIHMYNI